MTDRQRAGGAVRLGNWKFWQVADGWLLSFSPWWFPRLTSHMKGCCTVRVVVLYWVFQSLRLDLRFSMWMEHRFRLGDWVFFFLKLYKRILKFRAAGIGFFGGSTIDERCFLCKRFWGFFKLSVFLLEDIEHSSSWNWFSLRTSFERISFLCRGILRRNTFLVFSKLSIFRFIDFQN